MGLAGSGHLISDFLVEKKRTEKSRHIWNKVLVPWTFFITAYAEEECT